MVCIFSVLLTYFCFYVRSAFLVHGLYLGLASFLQPVICHLSGVSAPFTLKVLIDVVGFGSVILLLVLYLSCLFFLPFALFFCPLFWTIRVFVVIPSYLLCWLAIPFAVLIEVRAHSVCDSVL